MTDEKPTFPRSSPLVQHGLNEEENQLPSLHELWSAVIGRARLVLVVVLVGLLFGSLLAMRSRKYVSTATLRIQPGNTGALQLTPGQALSGGGFEDDKITTEMSIMQSRSLLLQVAGDLHLENDPEFWGSKPKKPLSLSAPDGRDLIALRMRRILDFNHEPKSEIVSVSCTTRSPLLSAKIANTVTSGYIQHIFEVRYGSTERVSHWLVHQLDDLKTQVEHDQEQLVDLQGKLGVLGLDQKNNAYLLADSLEGITHASGEATAERIIAEARLRVLESSDPNLIENEQSLLQGRNPGSSNSLLQNLRNSQAEAAAAYANLTAKFGTNYPDVKQSKAQLDAITAQVKLEQNRILNQAKISYKAASQNETMTQNALTTRKNEAFQSRNEMVRYVILQRQYESDRTLYEGLMQRLRVAGINAGLESAQVDIIDAADIPSLAKTPLPWQWFVLCVFGSLVFGILLAIVADRLDTRLGNPEEAQRQIGIPLLATLTHFQSNKTVSPFSLLTEGSAYGEGIQLLRGSLLMSRTDHPPRTLMITSALAGEGKSTVARNLAAMLAMHGARVVLVDADLHRPSLSKILKLGGNKGLSNLLTNGIAVKDAVVPVPEMNGLFFIPAGPLPPQPAILLSSTKMRDIVDALSSAYDFVVIDSPPVLGASDAVLLAPLVESSILVVRQTYANAQDVHRAISFLQRGGASITGFAMNGVDLRASGYANYYGGYGAYGKENKA